MTVDLIAASARRPGTVDVAPKRSRPASRASRAVPAHGRRLGARAGRHLPADGVPVRLGGALRDQADRRRVRQPARLQLRPTFQPYVDLWQTTNFYLYLANTLIVAVISTVVALLIGLPCAYALSRYGGIASVVLLVLALVFRALPRFAVVLPMYEISKSIGIYDTTYALAAALIAINQPFTIWLLRNFFAEIPPELDEAAMVDGCTRFGVLRRIMLPLMGPGILTAGIFVFLFAFQEYLTAAVLTDINAKTVPVFIATQIGQNLPLLQQASAATVLLTLPVVGIAFVAQKYLVAGLTSGAVKG